MSLAPASSRGAFLKARLAVNGIQCAARSLGTLTAAGRGLLSSMGASSSFAAGRRCPEAISFDAGRKRHQPHYFHTIGLFGDGLRGGPAQRGVAGRPASEIAAGNPDHSALRILGVEP